MAAGGSTLTVGLAQQGAEQDRAPDAGGRELEEHVGGDGADEDQQHDADS
jgi:hypothetical protein